MLSLGTSLSSKKCPETEASLISALVSLSAEYFPPSGGGVALSDPLLRERLVGKLGEYKHLQGQQDTPASKVGLLHQTPHHIGHTSVLALVREALLDPSVWDKMEAVYAKFSIQAIRDSNKAVAVLLSIL